MVVGVQAALPRLGLVATDELRIGGLRSVLEDGQDFEIVLLSTPKRMSAIELDVVLVDWGATEHLLELLRTFRQARPQTRLIVMGPTVDLHEIERVIDAGAKGYLSYQAGAEEVKMAIAVVRDGSIWAPRKVLARLLEAARSKANLKPEIEIRWTPRETEVLRLLMQGHSNREIGAGLGVSEVTVKAHIGRLMRKAGVLNRTALSMRVASLRVDSHLAP